MDFKKVIHELIDGLNQNSLDYALIGGMALHFLGYSRATRDFDLMVLVSQRQKLETLMKQLGFKAYNDEPQVAQY